MTTPLTKPIRPVSAKSWRTLALAGTALGLATSSDLAAGTLQSHALAMPEKVWLAQAVVEGGEGGEGGESGAIVAGANPLIAYLTRLYLVEGHLRAALALYENGLPDEAIGLSGHPEAEMMDEVRADLATQGAADFTPAMDAFTEIMVNAGDNAEVQARFDAVHAAIANAALPAMVDPRFFFRCGSGPDPRRGP